MNYHLKFSVSKEHNIMIIGVLLISLLFSSCKKKEPVISDETKEINQFIYDYTTTYYLWESHIPSDININNYSDPELLFEDMAYRTLDRWSFVVDNYQEILDALNGSLKTPGYQLQFYRLSGTGEIFAFTEYVYSGTPAEYAGMERGDVIIKVNGEALTEDNYTDVLYADQMTLGLGEINNGQIIDTGEIVSITPAYLTINPVLQCDVTDTLGIKIGYLLYDQFIQDFLPHLTSAVSSLETAGIDELVLDLRFNSGGYLSTCLALASMLVPSENQNDVFAYFEWNDQLTNYITETEGSDSENLVLPFSSSDTKLNLNRLFVLTSGKTASASEDIINGLSPYMDIVLIGDTTSGKYTGANFFYDTQANHNWGIYLVTSKILNSNGETDFVNGFAPNFAIDDDHTTALGDPQEPLFSKAIEIITGITAKTGSVNTHLYEKLPTAQTKHVLNNGVLIQNRY